MNTIQKSVTATAIAAALSLPLVSAAYADDTAVAQKADVIMLAANDRVEEAGDAVSDTWITTKVKSTLLADGATPGMDIEVETKDGVVSLSGTVTSEAEREMAINKAKDIKGVRDVAADGLKVAN